jgi:hypothetical protein
MNSASAFFIGAKMMDSDANRLATGDFKPGIFPFNRGDR